MELQKIQRTTLTMKEASEYLGISYWLINQLVRRKQIPCSKVQWLKLSTNFFDNNKIKLLESENDGDTLIRVWIQLLTIAMKCNYQGRLSLTEDKPMTVDEFSKIMGKSRKKITKCLEKFEELQMIIIEENFYKIKNWSKYQSADKLEEIRLQNCLRQQKYREKKKSETEKSNVTITQRNTKEEKKIRDKIEKEGDDNRSGFKEFKL